VKNVAGTLRVPSSGSGTRSVQRTGLLISVRSGEEAQIAVAGGADLIDVKEPHRGSLGAAEPSVWEEVLRIVAGRVPVSAALGELVDGYDPQDFDRLSGIRYAKLGLARCKALPQWREKWLAAMRQLPAGARPVAVLYADADAAHAPTADEILPLAAEARAPYLLIDTFDKRRGNLLAHWTGDDLAQLASRAAQHNIALVFAGSLDAPTIGQLAPLAPAYFAVRGAVCGGDRTQAIQLARVKRLVELVRTTVGACENVA
jgi:uncharacterized protein (UPF0264 family)